MPSLIIRRAFLTASAGFIALHPFSARVQAGEAHLRIMEITDIHAHIHPHDDDTDRPIDTVGLAHVRAEVGRSDAPLHSYFAPVADDPSVQIVSNAQTWYIAQMMVGTPHQGLPILAAAAPFKAGGRGGPEYFTDVPAVRINGALLREWLEGSAGLFNQITPGRPDRVLPNPEFPSCNFDGIGGGSCRIDLSQPVHYVNDGVLVNPDARRIVDRSCMGQPIDDAPEFVVAINNDRAGGGGLHRRGQGRDDRGRGRRAGRFRPLPHHAMAWAG